MSEAALELRTVTRGFRQGEERLMVLDGVDLTLHPGEVTALVGPSGSGKSTLLHICGLLDRPDSGDVLVAGRRCGDLDEAGRTMLRRVSIGFVYQFHHLLPEFSALENIILPQLVAGESRKRAALIAGDLLDRMGVGPRAGHRPAELSGGEQQRVAIARALANRPQVLLADEPTGNLDPETSETVFAELVGFARNQGVSALIATHNMELAGRMDRIITMRGGRLESVPRR